MAWLKNNYQFEFTDTLTTSWMSVRISNEKENGAVATFTDQYVTARSEDNSIVERMKGSASAWVLTLSMRGLDQTDTDTQVPWLKRERREWTKVFVTYVASQHVDAKGNNTFSWTQTFENITVSNNSALTNATVSGKYKWPVVADVIARDALYPTPVWWNEVFVQSLNAKQVYNVWTAQWESQAVWTPAPDATEVVKGISQLATNAEALAWTNDTKTMTPLKSSIYKYPEALFEKDLYIAWDTILANDSLFVESLPTFAESTVLQNIWDVTGNTRVAILWIGSGVASNTLKLSLRKFVSPSANLSVRIETVSGWNPTGTLVNANATATVTAASVTTSLVDTTITLAGSITITKWQQVAIVLSQVWDVVNATNYYAIGYVARDTSTRGYFVYNWSVRNPSPISDWIDVATTIWTLPDFFWNLNNKMWVKITMNQNSYLTSITKNTLTTATTAYLIDTSLVTIATATFVWNVATFSTQLLTSWVTYYLLVDAWWSNYASYLNWSMTYPDAYTRFNVIAWRDIAWDSSSRLLCITDITTQWEIFVNWPTNNNNFFYNSSPIFENKVLSKTSASYSYKLPTDYVRIATQGYSIWQSVISKYYGLHTYDWLVADTNYYIANTAGAISAIAGDNPYIIGKTNNTNILKIDWKNINKSITVTASPFSYVNTTGWPIQVKITGGTVNPIVINWVTTATATWHINTLPAWATMTVTYTVLPTITYSDL